MALEHERCLLMFASPTSVLIELRCTLIMAGSEAWANNRRLNPFERDSAFLWSPEKKSGQKCLDGDLLGSDTGRNKCVAEAVPCLLLSLPLSLG